MIKQSIKKNFFVFLFFIAITFLIFVLDQGDFFTPLKERIFSISAPALRASHQTSYYLTRPFRFLIELQEKGGALKSLREEKIQREGLQSQLNELERENEFLKEALGLTKKEQKIFLASQVIGRIDESGSIIMIDIGQEHGLQGGEAVLLSNYFLIGKVIEVWSNASQVMLINSKNFSASVRGQTSRTEALLSGAGDQLLLEIFDHQDKPKINELYLTSGLDGVFPPGLITGKLVKIDQKPSAISRTGWLELPINLRYLERVLILKKDVST